ncbi:MAG: DNA repair protein RecO [Gemmatimonadota bacterium]
MSAVLSRALVLRATPYGETSQIVRLLTERWGMVAVVARGARKSGGKGGAVLEPFGTGELALRYRDGRDLQTLHGFTLERARLGLVAPATRFAGASVLAELLLRAAPESPQMDLLRTVEEALDRLERVPADAVPGILLSALWQTVGALGYEPALDACVRCARPLDDAEVGRFDFGRGGVLCASCGSAAPGPRVGPGARAELAAFLDGGAAGEVGTDHLVPHLRLLGDFITYHVAEGRPLRSLDLLLGLLG